jgi:hypothetical protein
MEGTEYRVKLFHERGLDMTENDLKGKTLERATQQLDIIEQMITMLMARIDLDSLKTSERINFAIKFMTQHARTLKLYDDISRDREPSSGQQDVVDQLMRLMRNDPSGQDDDAFSSEDESDAFFFKDGI